MRRVFLNRICSHWSLCACFSFLSLRLPSPTLSCRAAAGRGPSGWLGGLPRVLFGLPIYGRRVSSLFTDRRAVFSMDLLVVATRPPPGHLRTPRLEYLHFLAFPLHGRTGFVPSISFDPSNTNYSLSPTLLLPRTSVAYCYSHRPDHMLPCLIWAYSIWRLLSYIYL